MNNMSAGSPADFEPTVPPLTAAWISCHLEVGERIALAETLHGGIAARVWKLTIGTSGGGTRNLVLRSYVDSSVLHEAGDRLTNEAGALTLLAGTSVPAPRLVAVDATAAQCENPSLLMTHVPGHTILSDTALDERVPLLANQLAAIHALVPADRPHTFATLTTADTVVVPARADQQVWAAGIDLLRRPAPNYEGQTLHRDFQPGNVLFDNSAPRALGARLTGVVDWDGFCWGPSDLDVAHCSANLALLHGPQWGLGFAAAYEEAGGVLSATERERQYWQVREVLACSEDVQEWARPWREAGRSDLTEHEVLSRLDTYLSMLLSA